MILAMNKSMNEHFIMKNIIMLLDCIKRETTREHGMKKYEKYLLAAVIVIFSFLVIWLGIKKVNYHCDEIWTYGLANHQGGINPEFEIGTEYSGMGPFEDFMEVSDGETFDYLNVWDNQAKDVHPPFYYLLIHTVSSLFKGTFSKWYGIGVNIFWMIFILILLYKLAKEITENIVASFGIVIAYASSVVFFDTMLLIRMYAQFTFFVVLLMYILKKQWGQKPDKRFLIKLGIILFGGMLTHYYFLLIAFFMCLVYGVQLIISKDKTAIRNYIVTLGCSGLVYGIVWYHILAHIFNGYRGEEAIAKATSLGGLFSGFIGMADILNSEAFAGLGIIFLILAVVFIIASLKNKKRFFGFEFYLFLCGIFYMGVVGKICPKITSRYIMPIAWIFILSAFLITRYLIQKCIKGKACEYIAVALFCIISIFNLASRNFTVPMDYVDEAQINAVDAAKGKGAVVYVDLNWKILYDFVILQNADRYVFADQDSLKGCLESQNEDYVFIVNVDEGRETVVNQLNADLMYDDGMNYYYLVHVK